MLVIFLFRNVERKIIQKSNKIDKYQFEVKKFKQKKKFFAVKLIITQINLKRSKIRTNMADFTTDYTNLNATIGETDVRILATSYLMYKIG